MKADGTLCVFYSSHFTGPFYFLHTTKFFLLFPQSIPVSISCPCVVRDSNEVLSRTHIETSFSHDVTRQIYLVSVSPYISVRDGRTLIGSSVVRSTYISNVLLLMSKRRGLPCDIVYIEHITEIYAVGRVSIIDTNIFLLPSAISLLILVR